MSLWDNFHYQLAHRHKIDGLPILFVSHMVRQVAFVFLGLFSPLYIFELAKGNGLTTSSALAGTFFFFWITFLVKLIGLPLAENLSVRFGFKSTILLSGVPFFVFLPLLVLGAGNPILLLPAAIIWGLYDATFWWGYHGFFVRAGDPSSYGREMGILNILSTIIVVISPILGALVVDAFGFSALFLVAGVAMALSLFLILPAAEHKPRIDITLAGTLKVMWEHKNMALAYVGYGAESSVLGTVWPLFLFIILGKTLEVGGVISGATLAAAVMGLAIGTWVDKRGLKGEKQLVSLGAPLIAATWFIRAFSRSVPALVGIDAVYRFVGQLVWLPLDLLSYRKATEGGGVNQAMMFRQIGITVGPIIITGILIFWVLLGGSLSTFFILTAVVALLPLLAVRKED
ncbi:MAG: MFS transporter [bacterium]|nr:MFS transporter [bacterium]